MRVSTFCARVRDLVLQIEVFDPSHPPAEAGESSRGESGRLQRFAIYKTILEVVNDYEEGASTSISAAIP